MLLLTWLPSPFSKPRRGRRWPSKRVLSTVCLLVFLVTCGYLTKTLIDGARGAESSARFASWRAHAERAAQVIDSQWIQVDGGLHAATPYMDTKTFTKEQVSDSSKALVDLLTAIGTLFNMHAAFVTQIGAQGLIEQWSPLDRANSITRDLERLRREGQDTALAAALGDGWIEVPELAGRSRRALVDGIDAVLSREEQRYKSDPTAWEPPLSETQVELLLAPIRGR